ncbi:MAG TPA: cytochrome c3 family protein [Chthoniobacterales bacterium]|nr:cytochrome c3 family protein [Chthoniobacterales bacterium]
MRRLLDQLSFKKNRYARPNQDWICGHADEGHPCPLGPDERGRCRHTGECLPSKSGDRWLCTRPEAQGGKCPEGPLPNGDCAHPIPPCQPKPSLRRTRGQLTWLLVALTLSVLLLVFTGKGRRKLTSPGALSVHHATSYTECEDCHTLEKSNSQSVAHLDIFQKRAVEDSQLCLKCHSLGLQPFSPHGAPAPELGAFTTRAKTEKSEPPLLLRAGTAVANTSRMKSTDLACSTCHQEHHGKDFNIAHFSKTQCQVCHQVQFASLAKGHPEFASYPYLRRTRIFFDHASHIQGYFPADKEKAPTSCQACHIPAVSGGKMIVNSFEQSCAVCHADNIAKSSSVAFFRVPGIDVISLARAGISIGQWPKDADDKLTPFMELLLGADISGGKLLATLKGKDLLDLSSASPEQLAAASRLAWAVKEFLYDFEAEGQAFLIKRLQEGLPRGQTSVQLTALTGGLPRAGLISWRKEWMPDLLREVSDYRRGVLPPLPPVPRAPPKPPISAPAKKAKQPPSNADILGGAEPSKEQSPPPKPGPAAPPGDDILGGAEPSKEQSTPAKPSAAPPPGDDILGGGEPSKDQSPSVNPSPPAPVGDDILGGAPVAPSPVAAPPGRFPPRGKSGKQRAVAAAAPLPKPGGGPPSQQKPESEAATDESWMAAGWFRAKDGFTLSYRPSGHADPFLTAWFNAAGIVPSVGSGILQTLATPSGPGSCGKCHTVDVISNGAQRVNWTAARSEPNAHPFTKFSHTAHLSVMTEKGCQTCHVLNPASKYNTYFQPPDAANPGANDPSHFESNFAPLAKMECGRCHTARIAGDNCLLCHNYHTGTFATDMSQAARIHPLEPQK